jgi:uncharacterized membrane protein YbaN (DUF454 family)
MMILVEGQRRSGFFCLAFCTFSRDHLTFFDWLFRFHYFSDWFVSFRHVAWGFSFFIHSNSLCLLVRNLWCVAMAVPLFVSFLLGWNFF